MVTSVRAEPADGSRLDAAWIPSCLDDVRARIVETADYTRTDSLWPSDYTVFSTNPLSVAFGACGTALFLDIAPGGKVPQEVLAWIRARRIGNDDYPPGLFMGLAGVGYTLLRLGFADEAAAALEMALASPLRDLDPTVFVGVAGWGQVMLAMAAATGDDHWLEHADRAARHLVSVDEGSGQEAYWTHTLDGKVHHGYGYGSSGIALFLAQAAGATGESSYAKVASAAIDFDLSHVTATAVGRQWHRDVDGAIVYPYWIHGTAGIGSVLIRCAALLGREDLYALALELADESYVSHSYVPGQFIGLAGIGEYMLDVFEATRIVRFQAYAHSIAETIFRFGVRRGAGLAFPGRSLSRLSYDFGTGSAGIGVFLARVATGGARLFLDLPSR